MLAHVVWTALLYALLTVMRAPAIWKIGSRSDGSNPWVNVEPRVSANLSNQFEWPLFFYVICILILINGQALSDAFLWLAWLFVIGRVIHSLIQILTVNIRLRGILFAINFVAVLAMWVLFFLKV